MGKIGKLTELSSLSISPLRPTPFFVSDAEKICNPPQRQCNGPIFKNSKKLSREPTSPRGESAAPGLGLPRSLLAS